ncbi:MAG: carboxylating nicotinate-nucleotide diphosphorylase [Dehalococcoidia bacterium]|nr:carboxylating nicotinate-nucleotide diphosphorylase [Dehalococcoidia bacterium]
MITGALPPEAIVPPVRLALEEDRAWNDATTAAAVPPEMQGAAMVLAKDDGVIAGLGVAAAAFAEMDNTLVFRQQIADGGRIGRGQAIATVRGRLAPILSAERVAINFLQRLSGVATTAARAVRAVEGTNAVILDTRKTTPGLRALEKYAVRCGGAQSHRMDLSDAILLKDNHLVATKLQGLSLGDMVRRAAADANGLSVEVEVTRITEAEEALAAGATRLLLDNMSPSEMATVVELARGRATTEASGGITLDNVRAVAETGVDFISMGSLTHSVKALDISLELIF